VAKRKLERKRNGRSRQRRSKRRKNDTDEDDNVDESDDTSRSEDKRLVDAEDDTVDDSSGALSGQSSEGENDQDTHAAMADSGTELPRSISQAENIGHGPGIQLPRVRRTTRKQNIIMSSG